MYFIRKVGSRRNLKNIDAILNLLHNKVFITLKFNRIYIILNRVNFVAFVVIICFFIQSLNI